MNQPAWVPCECGEFLYLIHGLHVFECDCPEIDEWEIDPYSEGGPADSEAVDCPSE